MFRYKIDIEYDGLNFCGWQRQASDDWFFDSGMYDSILENKNQTTIESQKPSVQSIIEKAIERITHKKILVEGAGRTDTGVHASGQAGHFDLSVFIKPIKLMAGINFYCKNFGVVIINIEEVHNSNFHARFSAIERYYEYHIINRQSPLAINSKRAWHISEHLNLESMQEAANLLIGNHNFTSFRAAECQSKNPIRTINNFSFSKLGDKIIADIRAKSFLHNQVRIMIGTISLVGKGKIAPSKILDILEAKDRTKAGPTAPPHGLYLTKVLY